MENRYPIRVAAKISGLSIDTLRAWERRHKAVVPERGARGRQYTQANVERLLLLAQLIERGHAIGLIAGLEDAALTRLLAEGMPVRPVEVGPDLILPIIQAIAEFDHAAAEKHVRRLAATLMPRDLIYQVMLPLMRRVGELWHEGTFSIAQEHMLSALVRSVLGGMVRSNENGKSAKILLATPQGEHHEFGILAAAMIVAGAGLDPIYLGPDLPAADLLAIAKKTEARVLVLGLTTANENVIQELWWLKAGLPREIELWIGGAAAGGLETSAADQQTVILKDFPALENECRRFAGRI